MFGVRWILMYLRLYYIQLKGGIFVLIVCRAKVIEHAQEYHGLYSKLIYITYSYYYSYCTWMTRQTAGHTLQEPWKHKQNVMTKYKKVHGHINGYNILY